MSVVKRLLHPHYVANVLLAMTYPVQQLIAHPDLLSQTSVATYSRWLLPAMVVMAIKVKGSQSAEELVSIIALYLKVFCVYGFWTVSDDRLLAWGTSWSGSWRIVIFLFAWLVTFIAFPQPSYQGPSKVLYLDPQQLEYLTTPGNKGPLSPNTSSSTKLKNRKKTAKIVELDDNGNDIQEIEQNSDKGAKSELDPSHYWVIAFNATWSSPCRHFEAPLARCSINVQFGRIDMDLVPEGDDIAAKHKINLAATTLDLPTLILFKDGQPLKRLPPKVGTMAAGEVLGKVGWDRSESSVVQAFELAALGTGKESFATKS
ncbi:Thioredoxin- transmembrane protein 2 [Podila humilis]|nr:Thioredoxin- transmembrane protein 2 [Podila humilis]